MPVVVHRQPWFWAVIIAVAAVLGFVVVIAASNRDREDSTTIVQQPAPPPDTTVVPVPGGTANTPAVTPPAPTEPERPERPAEPVKPAPAPQVKERVIEKERIVPVPVPVPSGEPSTGTTPPGPGRGDEFQNTGLKNALRFENSGFRAASRTTMDEAQLKSAGVTEDSVEVFVELNAQEPYTVIYVPIPDEHGAYVRYTRR